MSGLISAAGKVSRMAMHDGPAAYSCDEFQGGTQSGLRAKAL
jgi:hypothetical protein